MQVAAPGPQTIVAEPPPQPDSIVVDSRTHWRRVKVEDGGARVRVQPGVVIGHANRLLARHGWRIGPDPASTNIACAGGVIANNSGGMRCGWSPTPTAR
jgi:D-lactate dehydrogenase